MDNKAQLSLAEQVEKRPQHLNIGLIWFFISPYKIFFLLLVILSILIGLTETLNIAILYPIAIYALNIPSDNQGNLLINFITNISSIIPIEDKVLTFSILFILVAFLSFLLGLVYVMVSNKAVSRMMVDNKIKIFDKYISSDYQFFVDSKQGDLLYQTTKAPAFINESFLTLTKVIVDAVLAISIFLLLLSLSLWGTLIVLLVGSVYFLLSRYLSRKVSYTTGTGRYQASQKELTVLNEYISGIKIIKASEAASYWRKDFETAIRSFWSLWKKDNFWLQSSAISFALILYSLMGIIIIFVRTRYGSDLMSVIPQVVTFAFAAFRILPKLSSFGSAIMHIMSALPNLEIVSYLLKDTGYTRIINGSKPFTTLAGGIVFNKVQFTHKNRENTLKGVSLKISKDKVTAIVGPSGSGKSTIVDLMLRLYDIDQGEITIDGINIKHYDIASLRGKIGFVSQEPFIYNASVQDNITFGDEYNKERIVEAAKLAGAHDFISELPQGYGTLLGDRGVKLSGGEKQRIALARAMIRKPEILVLDEATSFLDYISELAVQKAIDRVSASTTTLIIAHRLSTIQNADIIYVLDEGKIVEQGNHDQLLQQKGKYLELYSAQNKTSMPAKGQAERSVEF